MQPRSIFWKVSKVEGDIVTYSPTKLGHIKEFVLDIFRLGPRATWNWWIKWGYR